MTGRKELVSAADEFLVFVADDGTVQVHVRIADGTVWLTQKQLAALYGKDLRTINEHLGNVYEEGEIDPEATIRKFRIVQLGEIRRLLAKSRARSSITACPQSSRSAIAYGRARAKGSGSGRAPGSTSTW